MFHRAREIMAQPAESERAVVFNWLTAIKFNQSLLFIFCPNIAKVNSVATVALSSLECSRC